MIDALSVIRTHVLTISAVTALVGSRVYAGEDVPPAGVLPGDGDCITFNVRGGLADYDDALLNPSVQFKCYSTSALNANTLYRALYDGLQNSYGANVTHVECEAIGQTLREPETEWPYVLSFWRFMLRQ